MRSIKKSSPKTYSMTLCLFLGGRKSILPFMASCRVILLASLNNIVVPFLWRLTEFTISYSTSLTHVHLATFFIPWRSHTLTLEETTSATHPRPPSKLSKLSLGRTRERWLRLRNQLSSRPRRPFHIIIFSSYQGTLSSGIPSMHYSRNLFFVDAGSSNTSCHYTLELYISAWGNGAYVESQLY